MENDNKVTAEELAAEQAAIQVPKEDEIRAQIITEFGFDEETDGEKIDKLVKKEVEGRKMLSKTIAQKIKHRTEAEELKKKSVSAPSPKIEEKDGLSSKDLIAIAKSDIHEDDLDEVLDYAKYKKISIADALKSSVIKAQLKEKEEQRKTAIAANTGVARRGSVKISDEEIVERVGKGELPEDPEALAKARWNLKKKK